MSALPPEADMCGANTNVRYGPEADIARWPVKGFGEFGPSPNGPSTVLR